MNPLSIHFEGKRVLITGAAHGFGREMACQFAALGAQVWAWDVLGHELEQTRQLAGANCQVQVVDVTDPAAVQQAAQQAGPIDILINNAGGVMGQVGQPLEQVTPQQWNAVVATNLSAAFYTSQAVVSHMKQAGWGRIINISSGAGLGPSLTGIQAYASAKAGLVNLTRQLCHELGPFNITVNCIARGFVRSNPTTERQWQSYGSAGQQRLLDNIALRRLGSPQDIAYGVIFFASELAGWVSGQVLSVDGGK